MPYRNKNTGEIISDEEFSKKQQPAPIQEKKSLGFGERLKMSFGGPETREELKRKEAEAGLRGRLDIGDIADVAGSLLPIAGGVIGGTFGLGGSAIGAGLGETARQAVGQPQDHRDHLRTSAARATRRRRSSSDGRTSRGV